MHRSRLVFVFAVILGLLTLHTPAGAAPVIVSGDHTDNVFSFDYNSVTGEMGTQASSRQTAGSQDVTFEVYVRESSDAGSGLVGRLKLRLEGDRHTVYDGWFSLRVVGSDGDTYYRQLRPATLHLRPRPGQRKATIRFRFDLPSGSYEAEGSFEAN